MLSRIHLDQRSRRRYQEGVDFVNPWPLEQASTTTYLDLSAPKRTGTGTISLAKRVRTAFHGPLARFGEAVDGRAHASGGNTLLREGGAGPCGELFKIALESNKQPHGGGELVRLSRATYVVVPLEPGERGRCDDRDSKGELKDRPGGRLFVSWKWVLASCTEWKKKDPRDYRVEMIF